MSLDVIGLGDKRNKNSRFVSGDDECQASVQQMSAFVSHIGHRKVQRGAIYHHQINLACAV